MHPTRAAAAILLVLVSACGGGGDSSDGEPTYIVPRWLNRQRKITAETLRDVSFTNAMQGMVVGDATSIYRTDDGGLTWYQLEHEPFASGGDILAFDWLPEDFHAVGRDENSLGRAWTSFDAVNWVASGAASGAPFVAVDVVNPGGANLSLYLRTNGQIARRQPGATPDTVGPSPRLASAKATGLDSQFSGMTIVVGTGGFFDVSTTFGATWHDWTGGPANSAGTTQDLFACQVIDWTQNWFVACGANGTVVVTEKDADAHPDLVPVTDVDDDTVKTLRALDFPVDFRNGWVVGDDGAIVKIEGTFDANTQTWSFQRIKQTSGTTADLYGIDMVDEDVGYAVGEGGILLKTIDGGANWSSPLLNGRGRSEPLNAVAFLDDAARGLAVGDDSTIPDATVLRTSDAGVTWTVFNSGIPAQDLVAVALPRAGSGTTGYVLGTAGLYRNLDVFGAGAWTAMSPPAGTWRTILAPAGDGTLILAGDDGAVAVTTTGTAALPLWEPQSLAGTPDLTCLLAVVNVNSSAPLAVFAGGKAGQLWRTELNGLWDSALVTTALGADILSLGGASSAQLFAGASDGKIHRLTFGTLSPLTYGREELPAPSPALGNPIAVAFPTANLGWWLAADGIAYTENANATLANVTWTPSYVHLTLKQPPASAPLAAKTLTPLRGLWMHPGGRNGYAVAQTGTVLRTLTGGK